LLDSHRAGLVRGDAGTFWPVTESDRHLRPVINGEPMDVPSDTDPATDPMLVLDQVQLRLTGAAGPIPVLQGVTLRVARGEAVALFGPSGSGKSTCLMALAGLEPITSGAVRVAGIDLGRLDEGQRARFRQAYLGIIFQGFHLIPTLTALENVAVPLELAGARDARERAAAELAAVGLGHRRAHLPTQLSGGEQQRVAIARALVGEPAILLADEPTGNLDQQTGTRIVDLIFELHRARGTTLILVSHDPQVAQRCDRIVRLRDGTVEAAAEASA
jgi:putative ABC transport system ATP-binding protein